MMGGTHAQADLDYRPEDEIFAVGVCFEVFDAEYADDLDDCHEETECEHEGQHDLG